jgi:hypothetical protein
MGISVPLARGSGQSELSESRGIKVGFKRDSELSNAPNCEMVKVKAKARPRVLRELTDRLVRVIDPSPLAHQSDIRTVAHEQANQHAD